jgi:hypothetical protein
MRLHRSNLLFGGLGLILLLPVHQLFPDITPIQLRQSDREKRPTWSSSKERRVSTSGNAALASSTFFRSASYASVACISAPYFFMSSFHGFMTCTGETRRADKDIPSQLLRDL